MVTCELACLPGCHLLDKSFREDVVGWICSTGTGDRVACNLGETFGGRVRCALHLTRIASIQEGGPHSLLSICPRLGFM